MKESDNKDVSNRAYRLLAPYSNTVDMAKKILLFYNGYLMASGNEKNVIDARHLNLLAYYFVFGYSYETKKKFSHCFSTDLQYVSVLDTEMKKRGILIDREGNYRTRCLCPDIENMRRLFVLEGSRDQCALVSLFYRKKNKYLCYAIIALVYIADLFICARGKIVVNTLTFVVIHLVIFGVCYRISWKSALFQSILLAAITSACEFLVIFIPYIRIIPDNTIAMTSSQSLILTFASKLLYLIGIMIISRVFCKKQKNVQATSLGLLSIPILTVIIIMLVMKVNTTSHLLSLVCFILIIMNIIIFAINQKLMIMETEKAELEAQQLKEKFDYDEYMMLKENNQQASILNHDFKEHIGALSSLIGADNETAQEYIKSICGKFSQPKFIEYSDNKILNVLLSKKKEECENQNIQFLIDPIRAELSFFNDMDIVTIFSNLINNAMESCAHSSEKKIYLNIHTENQNFIVIKIENTSDIEPIVINGRLKTHKDNAKLHGIGMNSISRALSAYNGSLDWKYNKEQKIFSTTIIIQNLTA